MNRRTLILALLLALIGGAVLVDRFVIKASDADEPTLLSESARARYEREAALASEKAALLEAEDEFERALGETRARWAELRERLVRAPSASLAEAQFRDEVLEFARRQNIREARTNRIESTPIGEGAGIRLVELVLEFETPVIEDVYTMVDGLENMDGMLTHVSEVDLSGPGRIPKRLGVSARITVQAIAHVGGEGR